MQLLCTLYKNLFKIDLYTWTTILYIVRLFILLVVDLRNLVVLLVTDRSTDRPTGKYRHTNM